jgi:zinc transporter, ZIP family
VPLFRFRLLRGADGGIQHAALAFTMGVLLLTTVEDVIPKGGEPNSARWISTAAFAGGFALFALLSSYSS